MKKSELVKILAEKSGLNSKLAARVVDTFFGSIKEALKNGDRVEIRGFGSFEIREYGSYVGINPKTRKKIQVPPKKLPFFKAGKELRERVDKGKEK